MEYCISHCRTTLTPQRPPWLRTALSERDYDLALAEVRDLMNAAADTARGDRMDVLVALMESSEAQHWAIDPPDPTDVIKLDACLVVVAMSWLITATRKVRACLDVPGERNAGRRV